MRRFKKRSAREVPAINTAALPDLIFTILFFFMMVTNMRPVSVQTKYDTPQATELQKLQKEHPIIYLIIGYAPETNRQSTQRESIQMQLNSEIVSIETLSYHLDNTLLSISPEEKENTIIALRADKQIPMGFIADIKKIIKEKGVSSIHYGAGK